MHNRRESPADGSHGNQGMTRGLTMVASRRHHLPALHMISSRRSVAVLRFGRVLADRECECQEGRARLHSIRRNRRGEHGPKGYPLALFVVAGHDVHPLSSSRARNRVRLFEQARKLSGLGAKEQASLRQRSYRRGCLGLGKRSSRGSLRQSSVVQANARVR